MLIEEKLLNNRIINLFGEINSEMANTLKMKLLYLDSISNKDIYLYIDSNGGDIVSGLTIIDCMNYIKSNVITICIGKAYSMASVILSAGTKGKRTALKHSEIMIHEASCSIGGKTNEVLNLTNRLNNSNEELAKIISNNSNTKYNKVLKDIKKDMFMTTKEALNYGIIDKIIDFKSN